MARAIAMNKSESDIGVPVATRCGPKCSGCSDAVTVAVDWNQPEDRSALPMSRDEARQCVVHIAHHLEAARALLLELYKREGWRALGYDSRRERRNWACFMVRCSRDRRRPQPAQRVLRSASASRVQSPARWSRGAWTMNASSRPNAAPAFIPGLQLSHWRYQASAGESADPRCAGNHHPLHRAPGPRGAADGSLRLMVGREDVMAGADCGFGTFAGTPSSRQAQLNARRRTARLTSTLDGVSSALWRSGPPGWRVAAHQRSPDRHIAALRCTSPSL
jgi:hypothetical protein